MNSPAPNPYIERDRRPLRERGSMYLPDSKATVKLPDINERVYRNYLGVLALLGRVAEHVPLADIAERTNLDQAFVDANEILRRKAGDVYFEKSSRGGYSMFDGDPLPPR